MCIRDRCVCVCVCVRVCVCVCVFVCVRVFERERERERREREIFVNLACCLELVIHWSFYRRLEQNWYEPHGTPRRMGTLTGAVSSRADTPRDGSLVGNLTLLVEWTQNWWEPRRKPQSGEFLPFSTDNKTGGIPGRGKFRWNNGCPVLTEVLKTV